MIKIALTGSIATGKSHVLNCFREFLIPAFSFDDEVAKLLKNDKAVISLIAINFPEFVENATVNIKKLSNAAFSNKEILRKLEEVIYPRLFEEYDSFLKQNYLEKAAMVVAEVPLLFEKHLESQFDKIILTTCSNADRVKRALKRDGMTITKLNAILENQMADSKKKKLVDFIISTSNKSVNVKEEVLKIIRDLT